MKRVTTSLKSTRSRKGLNLTDRELQTIMDGGSFELIEGNDYDGAASTVTTQLRTAWRKAHGNLKCDVNSGSIIVTVEVPTT